MNNIWAHTILFMRTFVPEPGGMNVHGQAILKKVNYCLTKKEKFIMLHSLQCGSHCNQVFLLNDLVTAISQILKQTVIKVFFFNDFSFISEISVLKYHFKNIKFILRSGGNDLWRAPINNDSEPLLIRQHQIKYLINKYVDFFIVNSDFSYLRSIQFGISNKIIKKVRGGVNYDNRLLHIRDKNNNRILFDNMHQSKGLILLTIACRFKAFKGVEEFVRKFVNLPNCENFFIALIGDGECRKTIIRTIENSRLSKQYWYFGALSNEDTLKVISYSDIVINPSKLFRTKMRGGVYFHTETMGRTMMEAVSLQVPIIATKVGATPEIFIEYPQAGMMANSITGICKILDRMVLPSHTEFKSHIYSWQNVYQKYEELLSVSKQDLLVIDLDDTILGRNVNYDSIKKLLLKYHRYYYLIINTAREWDHELKRIAFDFRADYIITGNGLNIYAVHKRFIWNKSGFIKRNIINKIERVYRELSRITLLCNATIKKTHPHIIQIDCDVDSQEHLEQSISRLKDIKDFYILKNNGILKIINRYLSKEAALNYLLKDLSYNKIYAAGNSLNDYLFVKNADFGWLAEDLKNVKTNNRIEYFEHDEIGIPLIKSIFTKANYI